LCERAVLYGIHIAVDVVNPHTTSWEEVSGTPSAFPPEAHRCDINDLVGMTDVVNALAAI
jgi:hypothetical protein